MTSEVVIMNRRAVALAADSAVTTTSIRNGQRERRHFKGANKVFELSYHHPVGIMIFDTADLHSVPWEVVIKMYRDKLKRQAFPTLSDYAKDFFAFLQGHPTLFSSDRKASLLKSGIFSTALTLLSDIETDPRVSLLPDENTKNLARPNLLTELIAIYAAWQLPSHFGTSVIADAMQAYGAEMEAALANVLASRSVSLSPQLVVRVAIEALFKNYVRFATHTGLIFTGFGDTDYFPSFIQYGVYGLSLGLLVADEKERQSVTPEMTSSVKLFAQNAMGWTFMSGVSPDMGQHVFDSLEVRFNSLTDMILKDVRVASLPNRDAIINNELKVFKEAFFDMQIVNHVNPLSARLRMVRLRGERGVGAGARPC